MKTAREKGETLCAASFAILADNTAKDRRKISQTSGTAQGEDTRVTELTTSGSECVQKKKDPRRNKHTEE